MAFDRGASGKGGYQSMLPGMQAIPAQTRPQAYPKASQARTAPVQGRSAPMTGDWSEAEVVAMIPELLSAPRDYAAYAGIGARETPIDVAGEMTAMAEVLEMRGFTMRSGGADGKKGQKPGTTSADTAFERGIASKDAKEIFLPWKGFANSVDGIVMSPTVERKAMEIAREHHPKWDELSDGVRKMHTRNVPQVLGPKLDSPVRFVMCWTIDGGATGGTGQAVRVADARSIPVLNLQRKAVREAVLSFLEIDRARAKALEVKSPDVSAPVSSMDAIRNVARDRGEVAAPVEKPFDMAAIVRPSREWKREESAVFFRAADHYGPLTNMGNKAPYRDGDVTWLSSEHQYQAGRFQGRPDIQEAIHGAPTAMDAKKIARQYEKETRPDWIKGGINVELMAYVVTRRRDQNPLVQARLDEARSKGLNIVEQSSRDGFWGAKEVGGRLVGQNVLGSILDQSAAGARLDVLPKGVTFPNAAEMAVLREARLEREKAERALEGRGVAGLANDRMSFGRSAAPVQREAVGSVREDASPSSTSGTGKVSYRDGNVAADRAQVIVNTVNSRLSPSGNGVMGAGVAKAFKERFPSIMKDYEAAIRSGELRPGTAMLFDLPDGRKWAALATKDDWKNPSKPEWVEAGLADLAKNMKAAGLTTVALPPPGCGNGGLEWAKVEPLVLKHMKDFDLTLYAKPSGAAADVSVDRGQSVPAAQSKPAVSEQSSSGGDFPALGTKAKQNMGMFFKYGRDRRPGFESASTFDAILAGERTSTTRFGDHAARLSSIKAGDVVRFYERADFWKPERANDKGPFVDVVVRGKESIDLAAVSDARLDEWSKVEGWSVEYGRKSGAQNGPGLQLRYEVIPGQEILKERSVAKEADDMPLLAALQMKRSSFGR
jgi:ribA/ribD-fused uncharacterized protein